MRGFFAGVLVTLLAYRAGRDLLLQDWDGAGGYGRSADAV